MTSEPDELPEAEPEVSSSLTVALKAMRGQAEAMRAELLAQDPADIDLVGRIPYLPRLVLEALTAIQTQLNPASRAALEEWQEAERQRARALWEAIELREQAFRADLPPNWKSPEIDFPDLEVIEELQLAEGLPLAWLPPNAVLAALLRRRTPEARRRLIAQQAAAILAAVEKELRRLRAPETLEWRSAAREATRAMQAGHWRAGQALAAVVLDTLTEQVVRSDYKHATQHFRKGPGGAPIATPPGSGDHSLPTWHDVDYPRALLVLYGVFGAFSRYSLRAGDPVPSQFTRHATVHSMGRPQYTKANALIALMHLTSLLCLVEDEDKE